MAPAGTLGKTGAETGALIGTYCTTNNIGVGGLSDVESTYTGDFITIAGKLFFKKIISYSSSMIRLNFYIFVAKNPYVLHFKFKDLHLLVQELIRPMGTKITAEQN